jgi:hypothetical protein
LAQELESALPIVIPRVFNSPVNFSLVNCDPLSLLKISGRPRRNARFNVSTQKSNSIVKPPTQHVPAVAVHPCHQVHKSIGQTDACDIRNPHLVDTRHLDALQQVRVDFVPFAWLA